MMIKMMVITWLLVSRFNLLVLCLDNTSDVSLELGFRDVPSVLA